MPVVDHVKAVGNISSRDMPFAGIDAVVIGVCRQPLAEVGQVGIDGERIADDAVFDGHAPGVPTRACGTADGVGAVGLPEGYAFCDQAIHVGRRYISISISGYGEVVLLVRVDEYNIRLAHFFSPVFCAILQSGEGQGRYAGAEWKVYVTGMHDVSRHGCALHVSLEYLDGRGHGRARRSR